MIAPKTIKVIQIYQKNVQKINTSSFEWHIFTQIIKNMPSRFTVGGCDLYDEFDCDSDAVVSACDWWNPLIYIKCDESMTVVDRLGVRLRSGVR